jgi:uncharacterized protein YbbC (DUF1343 family)
MKLLRHAGLLVMVVVLPARDGVAQAHLPAGNVRPGIDVLVEDSIQLVANQAVGLVTNQTGVDRHGVPDDERLRAAHIRLVALFTPEHGFRGSLDPGAEVASGRDSVSGLPIYSLYGRVLAPTPAMLEGIQVLLVDLQDVGARYYTYISTTIEVMRAAAAAHIPVMILDRPNPAGGVNQGNVLDTTARSFVGKLAVPMRHGLTMGELALMARRDLGLTTELHVIRVDGWRRRDYFDATGLPFVPPSPNLQTLESIIHYSGTCLFEGTNLSVGRGTGAAFTQVGAPWLDPVRVLATLGPEAGVELVPTAFTPVRPGDGKYADTLVQGIRLRVTDRARYDPPATALRLIRAIQTVHPDRFSFIPAQFDRLTGQPGLREALMGGEGIEAILGVWEAQRGVFLAKNDRIRLYPQ